MKKPVKIAPMEEQVAASQPPVTVISPDGVVGTVAADEFPRALETGYQEATPDAIEENKQRNIYGKGVLNQLEAGTLGFLRGSTLGLSDLAMRSLAPGLADSAAKLKKYNPDESLVGELASFATPGLGTIKALGSAGKAAKTAGLLQGLVSSGGAGLGKIATKIVGDNLAGHAIGAGLNMAAQSAVYQAAHNLSEDALGDKDLTAESILANTGQAAILGAGIGAALPVVARGTQAIAESAPVRYAVSGAAKQFAKFFDPDRSLQLYSGAMGNGRLLRDTIEGNAFKEATKNLREKGFYGAGKIVPDGNGTFKKIADGSFPSGREAMDRLTQSQDVIYNQVNETLQQADLAISANPVLKTKLSEFPAHAETAIRQRIADAVANAKLPSADGAIVQLENIKQLYAAKGGSLAGLNELKKGIYEGIDYKTAGKVQIQITKDIARAVKESIEGGVEAVRKDLPGNASLAAIKDLNKTWGQLETIREPLDVLLQKGESNVNIGGLRFRDMLTGIGGGFAGSAVGGPIGAAVGLGAGVANKMLQTDTGLLARAAIGNKLQKIAWAEQLMNKTQSEIATSIKSFLGGVDAGRVAADSVAKFGAPVAYSLSSKAEPSTRVKSQQTWFDDTRKQILSVASNPEQFAADQGNQAQPLADVAPGVADALIGKQLQVYAYLANAMPKNPGMPNNIFTDPWKPADYEVARFRKVVQVARAPLTILQDVRAGTVTADQVDAIKTLYPKLYESILQRVRQDITAPDMKTTYQQRLKLGQLFQGTEPTMAPEFIAAMQTPATKPDEPKNTVRPPGGQVKLSKNYATSTEQTANRQ